MTKGRFGYALALGVLGIARTAHAQVEPQTGDDRSSQQQTAQPAAATPPATAAPEEDAPKTMIVVLPKHRFELSPRLGAIAGGEVTPRGLSRGHSQASWIAAADFDAITLPFNPFFTLGAYAQITNTGYERYSGGEKTSTDGSMTLVSLGPSVKARFQITPHITAKAGIYLGYNHVSFSVKEDGKTYDASGGGLNVAFNGQLSFDVSPTIAIAAQLSFISQVAGGVTVGSTDYDLAMTPKGFLTVGPEFRF